MDRQFQLRDPGTQAVRVLLIEDNPGDARLIQEMVAECESGTWDMECVGELSIGLHRLTEGETSLVLLDLTLPDSWGLDTFAKVKPHAPGIPIIVLTGHNDERQGVEAVRQGAQDYLVKGKVDGNLLVRSMRYAIERKRVEEELSETQEFARNLVDSSLDMIVAVDRDRRIVEFNKAAQETFGYSEGEILGKPVDVLYADEPDGEQAHETAMAIGEYIAEITNKRKNGERFISFLSASVLRDTSGRILGVMGVSQDITERKRAEEALRASEDESKRLAQENTVIAEIGRIIGSSLNIERVYEAFSAAVGKLVQFDRIVIRLIDEDLSHMTISYVDGVKVPGRQSRETTAVAGHTQLEELLCTRTPSLIQLEEEADLGRYPGLAPAFKVGLRSFLDVPLFSKDKIIGVLLIRSLRPHAYTQRNLDLLGRVGNQIAGAISNAGLYEDLWASTEEIAVVDEVARIVTSTLDIDQVYEQFATEVKKLVDFDRMGINVIDYEAGVFTAKHLAGMALSGIPAGSVLPLEGSQTQQLIESAKSIVREDADPDSPYPVERASSRAGLRSGIRVPLIAKGRVVGSLFLRSCQASAYGSREQRVLERLASQIAPTIENAGLYEDLRASTEEMALVDEVARIVTSTLDIDQVYEQFATEVKKLVDFDRASIAVIDHENDLVNTKFVSGQLHAGPAEVYSRPLDGTETQHMLDTGQPVLREDIAAEAELSFRSDPDRLAVGLRSSIRLPLSTNGRVIGALLLSSQRVAAYGPREQAILERLASQIAPAVENASLYEEERQSQEQQRCLAQENSVVAEIGRIISSTLSIEYVFDGFMNEVRKLVSFDRAIINVVDTERSTCTNLYVSGGEVHDRRAGQTMALAGTQAEAVVRTAASHLIQTEEKDALASGFPGLVTNFEAGLRSFLSSPLVSGNRVIGSLNLRASRPNAYSNDDVKIVERVANQIAGAIANAQLYEDLRASTEEMALVDEVARIMTSTLDVDGVYEQFATEVKKLVDFDQAIVTTVDGDNGTIALDYVASPTSPVIAQGQTLKMEGTGTGYIADSGRSLVHGDLAESAPFWPWQEYLEQGLRSVIGVPLISNEVVVGAFALFSRRPHAYGPREQRILERLASQMAPAVKNAKLYEEEQQSQEQQRRLAQENSVLAEIGRIISSSLDIDEVYERLSLEVEKLIPFKRITVSAINYKDETSTPIYQAGTEVPGRQRGDFVPLPGTLAGEVAHTKSPIMLVAESEAEIGERFPGLIPSLRSGHRSFLATPLVHRDAVIGVLQIRSTTPELYREQDLALAERISTQIAGAVANAQLYEQVQRSEREQQQLAHESAALAEIGRIINSSLDISEVYDRFAVEVRNLIEFDRIVITTLSDDRESFSVIDLSTGVHVVGHAHGTIVTRAGTVAERVLIERSGIIVNVDEVQEALHQFPQLVPHIQAGLQSFLAVPLFSRDDVIGVLQIQSVLPYAYSDSHLRMAQSVANQIASAVANAGLYDEARRRESEIRRLSEANQRILASTPAALAVLEGNERRVVSVNRAFCDSFRVVADDVQGNPIAEFLPRVELEDAIQQCMRDPANGQQEMRFTTAEGSERWLAISATPLRGERESEGESEAEALLILSDITEQKQQQEKLQETARLASIGELAAGVAHEINNPLAGVLGFSQLLMARELPTSTREDVQKIYEQAQRASKVVQNLLSFARRHEPERQFMDVPIILNRALELKAYDFRVNNIQVTSYWPKDLPRTMVDEHQLVQVILNLLTNAEQAMLEANGKGELIVGASCSREKITIIITDDGPGIPAENLHKVFDPFFTTKDVGQGTGLGLSICYGIVTEHGGNIWAESPPGKGTTFYIELPVLHPSESDPDAPVEDKEANMGSAQHILVVDDEPVLRDLMSQIIHGEGHSVDLASDGREAWDMIQAKRYDRIILDLKMPGMGGQEFYSKLSGFDPDLRRKVIFVTGVTATPKIKEFLDKTGNPVLSKPFDLEEVRQLIRGLAAAVR